MERKWKDSEDESTAGEETAEEEEKFPALRAEKDEGGDGYDAVSEDEFEVEAVKDARLIKAKKRQYLVKWLGYSEETWEPSENLVNNAHFMHFRRLTRKFRVTRNGIEWPTSATQQQVIARCIAAVEEDKKTRADERRLVPLHQKPKAISRALGNGTLAPASTIVGGIAPVSRVGGCLLHTASDLASWRIGGEAATAQTTDYRRYTEELGTARTNPSCLTSAWHYSAATATRDDDRSRLIIGDVAAPKRKRDAALQKRNGCEAGRARKEKRGAQSQDGVAVAAKRTLDGMEQVCKDENDAPKREVGVAEPNPTTGIALQRRHDGSVAPTQNGRMPATSKTSDVMLPREMVRGAQIVARHPKPKSRSANVLSKAESGVLANDACTFKETGLAVKKVARVEENFCFMKGNQTAGDQWASMLPMASGFQLPELVEKGSRNEVGHPTKGDDPATTGGSYADRRPQLAASAKPSKNQFAAHPASAPQLPLMLWSCIEVLPYSLLNPVVSHAGSSPTPISGKKRRRVTVCHLDEEKAAQRRGSKSPAPRVEEASDGVRRFRELVSVTKYKPISVFNGLDFDGPPDGFCFTDEYIFCPGVREPDDAFLTGCACAATAEDNRAVACCVPGGGCRCLEDAEGLVNYTAEGLINVERTSIVECNKRCACSLATCPNRVVERGRKVSLEIYKTRRKGWGVRAMEYIPRGTYIDKYAGEVITSEEAEARGRRYDATGLTYLFDLDGSCELKNTPGRGTGSRWLIEFGVDDENVYSVDASRYGNVTHFFNHSCDPNLVVYPVFRHPDRRIHDLAFFAKKNITRCTELTFDYQMKNTAKRTKCECKTSKCRGWVQ